MEDQRPDPDRLLRKLRSGEKDGRGRLKIFLGACAGVGKTYTMLGQAREKLAQGIDLVVGWAETHGRAETAALLEGTEILPPRSLEHRGVKLLEFDLDAALRRRPAIILVDELAHTNAPGARHSKRWQDVEELLEAGIDVYTTLNVQHLESVGDIVAQTTGVIVRETVPDSILDRADEIELVDLPPEDLLQRLREGKVYIPEQAQRAAESFFQKGNLIALRELALRRVAERVDAQMRSFKDDEGIRRVWPVAERIMVCVSPNPSALRVVRSARRMAERLGAEWIVAYVEVPGRVGERDRDREQIDETLRIAERLGAETVTLGGGRVAEEILAYARSRNVTQIVVGKPGRAWWRYRLLGSVVEELVRRSDEIDVHVIRGDDEEDGSGRLPRLTRHSPVSFYLWSLVPVAVCSLAAALLSRVLTPANLAMIFLLGVAFTAARFGRGPSILASLLSVAVFDFFFVKPYLTFSVHDTQYFVTFGVMFVVAILISTLAIRLREQAEAHRRREARTAGLYRMSRELSRAGSVEEAVRTAEKAITDTFEGEVWILLADAEGRLEPAPGMTSPFALSEKERGVALWAHEHGRQAGLGTGTLPSARAIYVPLFASGGSLGVLGFFPAESGRRLDTDQTHQLEAFAAQTAVVIERAMLARVAQEAQVRADSERLRSALLSSVSHDLRTPLATIAGAASGLVDRTLSLSDATQEDLAQSIYDEAERLNRLVGNLLSMTRLESGALRVRKEWIPIDEVLGAAVNQVERRLGGRKLETKILGGDALVPLDGILIGQVLVNLLDNAIKYTPEGSPIEIAADVGADWASITVADRGPGLPPGTEVKIFELFYQVEPESRGSGLGLAICRGIVEAHGGEISARNRPDGGLAVSFRLPVDGEAPVVRESAE